MATACLDAGDTDLTDPYRLAFPHHNTAVGESFSIQVFPGLTACSQYRLGWLQALDSAFEAKLAELSCSQSIKISFCQNSERFPAWNPSLCVGGAHASAKLAQTARGDL